jgi:hypothetical protein
MGFILFKAVHHEDCFLFVHIVSPPSQLLEVTIWRLIFLSLL